MYVCMYVRKYVCLYVCMYVCMYVCKYVGMYVCIYLISLMFSNFFNLGREDKSVSDLNLQEIKRKWLGEAIQKAAEDDLKTSEILGRLPADGELFEGDMVMDDLMRSAVLGRKSKKAASKRSRRWPNNVLVYEIDASVCKSFNSLYIIYRTTLITRTLTVQY